MEKITINWATKAYPSLCQAVSRGVEFCMMSDDMHQCSPFMLCKDYLQDAIHGVLNKKRNQIYGFTYDPKQEHHPCLGEVRLVVVNSSDAKFAQKVANCLDFLHQVEEALKFPKKTQFSEVENPPKHYKRCGAFLIRGHQRWQRSTVMISLYSLLIRVGFGHTPGTPFMDTLQAIADGKKNAYCDVDTSRVKSGLEGIKRIVKEGDIAIFGRAMKANYPPDMDVGFVHNNSGIVSFSAQYTAQKFPQWHKKK